MAYDNIKILCQGYQWADSVPLEKCNFFSAEARTPFTPEIDLMDFVIKGGLGNLKYQMDDSENENGISELFFVSGNITLKLSGIVQLNVNDDFPTLKEFFEITSDISDRHSYLVRMYHNEELLFQGTVYQNGLREPFNLTPNSEVISCLIVGFENELKSHLQNENLYPHTSQGWNYIANDNFIATRPFQNVLEANFHNPFITQYRYEADILEYYMCLHPSFKLKPELGFWHNKQGYERMFRSGMKRWDWFISTMNSMGWTFFIFKDTLYIKNRASASNPLVDIEFAEVAKSYELGKRKPNATFDYIMLLDGAYYGGDGAFYGNPEIIPGERPFRGERPVILTSKQQFYKSTSHFNRASGSAYDGNYDIHFDVGYEMTKYRSENDDTFGVYNITKPDNQGWAAWITLIEQDKILRLKTGDSGIEWWRVRLDQGYDSPYDRAANFPPTVPHQLEFTGCAGSALVKRNGNFLTQNFHQHYVNSAQFINNYSKYLNNRSTIYMSAKLSGILKNPLQDYRFINSGYTFFDNARWAITSLEIDLEKEETSFDLQKIRTART